MGYRGVVRGKVVTFEGGPALPEGTEVEVTPVGRAQGGSPAALLEVWGSDVPAEAWEAVERAVGELDRLDRESARGRRRA
jgi:hypothetical protein